MNNPTTSADYAEIIVRTLDEHCIDPIETFTAVAGSDYGLVRAWMLAGCESFAIAYGDSGQTNYSICSNMDDLGEWLIDDNASGLDAIRGRAGVYGIETIKTAPADSENICAVLISRNFYGPRSDISVAMTSDGQREEEFETAADAQAWIDEVDGVTYYLSHNESSRPTYKIVEI